PLPSGSSPPVSGSALSLSEGAISRLHDADPPRLPLEASANVESGGRSSQVRRRRGCMLPDRQCPPFSRQRRYTNRAWRRRLESQIVSHSSHFRQRESEARPRSPLERTGCGLDRGRAEWFQPVSQEAYRCSPTHPEPFPAREPKVPETLGLLLNRFEGAGCSQNIPPSSPIQEACGPH